MVLRLVFITDTAISIMQGGCVDKFIAARGADQFEKHFRDRGPIRQRIARCDPFVRTRIDEFDFSGGAEERLGPVPYPDWSGLQGNRCIDVLAAGRAFGFAGVCRKHRDTCVFHFLCFRGRDNASRGDQGKDKQGFVQQKAP